LVRGGGFIFCAGFGGCLDDADFFGGFGGV